MLVQRKLNFGPVRISWILPEEIKSPIAVSYWRLNGKAVYVTQCPILFKMGDQQTVVPAGFIFDGASIPRIFWVVPGFSPLGKHLWAACVHDFLCENPKHASRDMADSFFYTILRHTGVGFLRAKAMHIAVRLWGNGKAVSTWVNRFLGRSRTKRRY
jgi:hypothetical protein